MTVRIDKIKYDWAGWGCVDTPLCNNVSVRTRLVILNCRFRCYSLFRGYLRVLKRREMTPLAAQHTLAADWWRVCITVVVFYNVNIIFREICMIALLSYEVDRSLQACWGVRKLKKLSLWLLRKYMCLYCVCSETWWLVAGRIIFVARRA